LSPWQPTTSTFCSRRCGGRFRDRRRQAEHPEERRAKAKAYYEANRERVLAKAKERRLKAKADAEDPADG
jgi:hypothetical protein